MEEMNGASHGEGDGASMPSPGAMLLKSLCVLQPRNLQSLSFRVFFFFFLTEASSHRQDWLTHHLSIPIHAHHEGLAMPKAFLAAFHPTSDKTETHCYLFCIFSLFPLVPLKTGLAF